MTRRPRKGITERFAEPPFALALLRIVVPIVILASPELHRARVLAAAPSRLAFAPEGLGLLARLEISAATAHLLYFVAIASAATAIVGWLSRVSLAILTLSAGLLFSLSQREGAVVHDMHLFWFTALLALSPAGNVWAIDAWGRGRPAASIVYGIPLTLIRLLLGLVYVFPGLHKLRTSGLSWISADNVIGHMRAKWLEHGIVPALRIDHAPALCALGAAFVIVFELTFVALALGSARTRWVALAAGLAFHLSTQVFFFIPFVSLWACYVVLVDGRLLERIDGWIRTKRESLGHVETKPWAPLIVGVPLVVAAVVQGARGQTQAWPVACYPTFSHVQPSTIPDLVVAFTKTDGTTVRLTGRERVARSQAEWGRVFRIEGAYGDRPLESALRAHARAVAASAGIAIADVREAHIYRVDVSTDPEQWRSPPLGGVLLMELGGTL